MGIVRGFYLFGDGLFMASPCVDATVYMTFESGTLQTLTVLNFIGQDGKCDDVKLQAWSYDWKPRLLWRRSWCLVDIKGVSPERSICPDLVTSVVHLLC